MFKLTYAHALSPQIESLLSGGETDTVAVLRSLHELVTTTSVDASDALISAYMLLRIIVRLLTKTSFATAALRRQWMSPRASVFLDDRTLAAFELVLPAPRIETVHSELSHICANILDNLYDACLTTHRVVPNVFMVQKCLDMLFESAVISGLSGLQRECDASLSHLCRLSVPPLHDFEIVTNGDLPHQDSTEPVPAEQISSSGSTRASSAHCIVAFVRAAQVVSCFADSIQDWDAVVAAFERLSEFYSGHKDGAPGVSQVDVENVLRTIERFKLFTVYLSNDALVKLTTSLVIMSCNAATEGAEAKVKGAGYSLQAIVDITKLNAFRASSIWQMVCSHLRMLASTRSPWNRHFAVDATVDLISASFEGQHDLKPVQAKDDSGVALSMKDTTPLIKDKAMFTNIFPRYDQCFEPRRIHKDMLLKRYNSASASPDPALSQEDLLSSLKSLSLVRYADVQCAVIDHLFVLLQQQGHALRGGWSVIVELLTYPPTSFKRTSDDEGHLLTAQTGGGSSAEQSKEGTSAGDDSASWPIQCLSSAFNCMKLMLDDFLEYMSVAAAKALVLCLLAYGQQTVNNNIALTSVELLWKAYDSTFIRFKSAVTLNSLEALKANQDHLASVLHVILQSLQTLCVDPRPEIRNCSMDSLFSLLGRNTRCIPARQVQEVFATIVFPLFELVKGRSVAALDETALAPELKKGVKMNVHHSRDTTSKQWSETRSLLLRGLERFLQVCIPVASTAPWFKEVWKQSLHVCKEAIIRSISNDPEVSQSGLHVLFAMLKMSKNCDTAEPPTATPIPSKLNFSKDARPGKLPPPPAPAPKEDLWILAWMAVKDASAFSSPSSELAIQMCQSLSTLYTENAEVFQTDSNLRVFLDVLAVVSRPRLESGEDGGVYVLQKESLLSEQQLQRALMAVLKEVKPKDVAAVYYFCSTLAEIAFSTQGMNTVSI